MVITPASLDVKLIVPPLEVAFTGEVMSELKADARAEAILAAELLAP